MVDTLALGASAAMRGGSSPLLGTVVKKKGGCSFFIYHCDPGEDLKGGGREAGR